MSRYQRKTLRDPGQFQLEPKQLMIVISGLALQPLLSPQLNMKCLPKSPPVLDLIVLLFFTDNGGIIVVGSELGTLRRQRIVPDWF